MGATSKLERGISSLATIHQPLRVFILSDVRLLREGRETRYSARMDGLRPLVDWMEIYSAYERDQFKALEKLLKRMDK